MTIAHPSGDKHWTRLHPESLRRGPDAQGARLGYEQVAALHADLKAPGANKTHLAAKYGVSRSTIVRHARTMRETS